MIARLKCEMTARAFFDLVREMRETQKGYFLTRSRDLLEKNKQLEREVDREIASVDKLLGEKSNPGLPLEK